MKLVKEVAGRIFALWTLIWFIVTMFVFLIPYFIISRSPEPLRTHRFVRVSRAWMLFFLTGIGCPLTVYGKKHFRKGENYIVLFNHNSFMDVPISSPHVPGGNKTIAKTEIAKVPVFGLLYKMGSVLVDRKSETSRRESIIKMKEVLAMGLHMSIYPEGTRNKTDQPLKPFHNGAFRLSVDTGKSIMPALIFHTRKVLPAGKSFYLIPHRLEMHFLPPVAPVSNDTAESLKERVWNIMNDYYTKDSR
ncbi:MAG: 1-acyl-sn-glycerol-3-phosphate acyltransferase [Chitinophagaceae bacterium]|nr:1-acyl-sn-glycerol-3-phosphate acyltransferase [Chitinophagaceae bacterium]